MQITYQHPVSHKIVTDSVLDKTENGNYIVNRMQHHRQEFLVVPSYQVISKF